MGEKNAAIDMDTLNIVFNRWGIGDLHTLPPLGGSEVHIWHLDMDDPGIAPASLYSLLDVDECARCARLRMDTLQYRFAARHGVLRLLLGSYMGVAPEAVCFAYGERGKPALAAQDAAPRIFFNMSDADHHALFALTRMGEIGVDLELAAPFDDMPSVASAHFSPNEQAQLAALPDDVRTAGFYTCWTRKEAIIKCAGGGLAIPLDSFSVTLTPGQPAVILEADDPHIQALTLREIVLPVPFVAACAVAPLPHLHSSLRLP